MAFDLETLKTRVTDFLHTLEADLGPWVAHLKDGFHAVATAVHQQAEDDEKAAENVAVGAVKTLEKQAEDDVAAASEAAKGDTGAAAGKSK